MKIRIKIKQNGNKNKIEMTIKRNINKIKQGIQMEQEQN